MPRSVSDPRATVADAAAALAARLPASPRAVFLLGTGPSSLARHLDDAVTIAPAELPQGVAFAHDAPLCAGILRGRVARLPVLVTGACLPYHEGHPAEALLFPLRVFRRLGASVLVVTAGAASLGDAHAIGSVAVVEDHLDLSSTHVLRAAADPDAGPRFLDQRAPYAEHLREAMRDGARALGRSCRDAVVAAVPGPVLPTRAECRALRTLGADVVAMSLVPEAIAARHAGFAVAGLTAIVQRLDQDAPATSVPDLIAAADAVEPEVTRLLLAAADALAADAHA